jgi:hypothetical protein
MAFTATINERTASYVSAALASSADADTTVDVQISPDWRGVTTTAPASVQNTIAPTIVPRNATAIVAGLVYTGLVLVGSDFFLRFTKTTTLATAGASWLVHAARPSAITKRR